MDPDWYRAMNPDVAASGADPADHFLRHGWREGRDPVAAFSVRDYLELYPDVAAAGINPFLHWLKAGRAEGRLPRRDVGRTARAAEATGESLGLTTNALEQQLYHERFLLKRALLLPIPMPF